MLVQASPFAVLPPLLPRRSVTVTVTFMPPVNVQFAVGAHVLAVLAHHGQTAVTSELIARSINADPSFVRRSMARLGRAGLVETSRGANGASALARASEDITLLDVYAASGQGPVLQVHSYPIVPSCPVSPYIKPALGHPVAVAQSEFEKTLDRYSIAALLGDIQRRRSRSGS